MKLELLKIAAVVSCSKLLRCARWEASLGVILMNHSGELLPVPCGTAHSATWKQKFEDDLVWNVDLFMNTSVDVEIETFNRKSILQFKSFVISTVDVNPFNGDLLTYSCGQLLSLPPCMMMKNIELQPGA